VLENASAVPARFGHLAADGSPAAPAVRRGAAVVRGPQTANRRDGFDCCGGSGAREPGHSGNTAEQRRAPRGLGARDTLRLRPGSSPLRPQCEARLRLDSPDKPHASPTP